MKKNDFFREIDEDKILHDLTETLKVAKENAESIPDKIERRISQLLSNLEYYDQDNTPSFTGNIDDIEKEIQNAESRESIGKKINALRKIKRIAWTNDKNYREAMAQYFTYITPILTDIERAKALSRARIKEIHKEILKEQEELNIYESKVKELIGATGEYGPYVNYILWENQFNRMPRSDYFASVTAEAYKKDVIENKKERVPKITKHESINGLQRVFASRPRG